MVADFAAPNGPYRLSRQFYRSGRAATRQFTGPQNGSTPEKANAARLAGAETVKTQALQGQRQPSPQTPEEEWPP